MNNRWSPLLLDIDIDFVLDRRLSPSDDRERNSSAWISSKRLYGSVVAKGLPPVKEAVLLRDHGEAYTFWRALGVRSSHCVHIDAHSDLYGSVIDPNRLLAEGYEPVAGNFLRFALAAGIAREVTLVPPDWFCINDFLREDVVPFGYAKDPKIRVAHLNDVQLPLAEACVVTIATSPKYTPAWVDNEARDLLSLFTTRGTSYV